MYLSFQCRAFCPVNPIAKSVGRANAALALEAAIVACRDAGSSTNVAN